MPDIGAALRTEVRSRAQLRCEYCLSLESLALVGHEVDHIIAVKHGGTPLRKTWRCVVRSATSIRALTWRPSIAKPVRCSACFTLVATNGANTSNYEEVRLWRALRSVVSAYDYFS